MKTHTHGNGHGLDDLYILPDNDNEAKRITDYLAARGIGFDWSLSDVEGQDWFGKRFIEIPFGEGYLGVIQQAASVPSFRCTFTGRLVGAIGIMYPCEVTVDAADAEAALLACYDTHEHITGFSAERVE